MAKDNITMQWLKGFEILAGRPIVLSLVIDSGKVRFVSCIAKDYHQQGREDEEECDEMPSIDLEEAKKHVKAHELSLKNYIG